MVSIYWGFAVLNSIFSRIFLICTVTVAISPMDSMSQILLNSSSFVYTWLGFCARKVSRSNSLDVNAFSSPLIHTLRAVLSILMPRISTISFSCMPLPISLSYRAICAFTLATSSLGLKGLVM